MVKLHKINTQCVNEDLDIVLEASVERQRVQKFMDDNLGKGYFDKYLKIRDRFTDMNLKDFNKIIKLDPEDVKVAIDRYDSASTKASTTGGKKKVGENSDWVVYHVTSFPAAQELGEGTEWCITGRYGNMDPNDDHYFNDYIRNNNLDGGYYFYIPKDGSDNKHCLLLTKNGDIHSIWGSPNGEVHDISDLNFPEVKGIDYDKFKGETIEDLFDRLREAYNNDDAEEWSMVEYDINERGGEVPSSEYPDLDGCVVDNKPNLFRMLLEWGFEPDSQMEELLEDIYIYRTADEREAFISELRDYRSYDDAVQEVLGRLHGDDLMAFIKDYYDSFSIQQVYDKVGLSGLVELFKYIDVSGIQDMVEDYEDDINSLIEDLNDFEDEDTTESLEFLKQINDYTRNLSIEDAFKDGGRLHLYDIINDTGLRVVDGEWIKGLYDMGARLSKEEAKKLQDEIDDEDIESFVEEDVLDVIKKSL